MDDEHIRRAGGPAAPYRYRSRYSRLSGNPVPRATLETSSGERTELTRRDLGSESWGLVTSVVGRVLFGGSVTGSLIESARKYRQASVGEPEPPEMRLASLLRNDAGRELPHLVSYANRLEGIHRALRQLEEGHVSPGSVASGDVLQLFGLPALLIAIEIACETHADRGHSAWPLIGQIRDRTMSAGLDAALKLGGYQSTEAPGP